MFTDMVGFTTLSQRDEAMAFRLLEEQRSLLRPLFGSHGGRVIKTLGDGFLVEFASAVESVRCAQRIQGTIAQRNSGPRAEGRLLLRVGIHVGDILGEGDDIVGDAVNVASRIEPLADPGGICVSGQVLDQIRNKVPVTCRELVAPSLKNVESPIQVFRVEGTSSDRPAAGAPGPAASFVRLAVLPFRCLSANPADRVFAEGLTVGLINHLAQGTALRVVALTSVLQYRDAGKRIREIGRELAVGSIIEGSVRRSANAVRIAVQLVDAGSEEPIWAQHFDRELVDSFALEDEIALGVTTVLQRQLVARIPPAFRRPSTIGPSTAAAVAS